MGKEMKDLGLNREILLACQLAAGLRSKNARLAATRPGVLLFPLTPTFSGQWGTPESFPVAPGVPTLP